jgi:ATP/maltotriose-dependent transcriptional regulator MalT
VEISENLSIDSVRELLHSAQIRVLDISPVERHVSAPHHDVSSYLTPAERTILILLTRIESNAGLAERLSVSEATIKTHLRTIFRKLRVRSRTAAVGRAVILGLISVEEI